MGYESVICYESRDSNCRANAAYWSYIKTLLAGHSEIVGAQTLTRFFAIHVFFLPAALLGLMAFHFIMIRKQGISGAIRDC